MNLRRDLTRAGLALLIVLGAFSSLTRVFSDLSWVPVTVGAAVLAVLIAAGTRALGFGTVASVASTLIGLFAFTYTQHLSAGPLIPGPAQLGEARDLLSLGLQQFRDEPAPTVPLDGLLLITSTSAWIVAWLTHELLIRWHSVGLALVPAGVLWTVPLAVPLPPGRTWPQALPFAAVAALTLLVEGDRDMPAPGVRTRVDAPQTTTRRAAMAVGGALAVLALGLAAFAPAVLPGYGADSWVDLASGPDPRGYQPIVDIGDRLKLPAAADIMTVRADRKVYLRLAALDSFDGTTWKVGPADQATFQPSPDALFPADGQLPREQPIAESVPVEVEVEVLDLENIYVPVPYQAVRLFGDGVDEMVYSTEGGFVAAGRLEDNEIGGRQASGIRAGTSYRVESVLPASSYETLAQVEYSSASVARWTQLPRDYSRLAQTALEVYEATGATTAIDRAFALQDWFTGPNSEFRYSLDADALRGDAALEDFLYTTKTGYCEYYATAMAVMLRATGIPARVSVGFLAGSLTLPADPGVGRTKNTYTVSTTDAHAWVEVLFPGHGWIRFEPTPRSDGAVQPPTPDDLDPLLTSFEQRLLELDDQAAPEETAPTDAATAAPSERDLSQFNDENEGFTGDQQTRRQLPRLLFVLVTLLALAAVPVYRFRGRSHHADVDPAQRVRLAQRRLHDHATAYGVGRRLNQTPREIADDWVAQGRVEPAHAERFTDIVESTMFSAPGQRGIEAGVAQQAEELSVLLVDGLRQSVTPRERVLAPYRRPLGIVTTTWRRVLAFWTSGR